MNKVFEKLKEQNELKRNLQLQISILDKESEKNWEKVSRIEDISYELTRDALSSIITGTTCTLNNSIISFEKTKELVDFANIAFDKYDLSFEGAFFDCKKLILKFDNFEEASNFITKFKLKLNNTSLDSQIKKHITLLKRKKNKLIAEKDEEIKTLTNLLGKK